MKMRREVRHSRRKMTSRAAMRRRTCGNALAATHRSQRRTAFQARSQLRMLDSAYPLLGLPTELIEQRQAGGGAQLVASCRRAVLRSETRPAAALWVDRPQKRSIGEDVMSVSYHGRSRRPNRTRVAKQIWAFDLAGGSRRRRGVCELYLLEV